MTEPTPKPDHIGPDVPLRFIHPSEDADDKFSYLPTGLDVVIDGTRYVTSGPPEHLDSSELITRRPPGGVHQVISLMTGGRAIGHSTEIWRVQGQIARLRMLGLSEQREREVIGAAIQLASNYGLRISQAIETEVDAILVRNEALITAALDFDPGGLVRSVRRLAGPDDRPDPYRIHPETIDAMTPPRRFWP